MTAPFAEDETVVVNAPAGKAEKYARREMERRFLLAAVPDDPAPVRVTRISDLYLTGTRLRLRRTVEGVGRDQAVLYKLTQKVPSAIGAPPLITTLYLSSAEHQILGVLPGATLTKTRLSIPPFGVDVFDPPLDGLLLAEIEFESDSVMEAYAAPTWAVAEVTSDARFTGGRLASTGADELRSWLGEFRIAPA